MTTTSSTKAQPGSDLELEILLALVDKPLNEQDLVSTLTPTPEKDVKSALYQLTQKYLITKQPVIGGGCRDCACQVSYSWRLTLKGREAITTGEAT
jgi:hypothetical protein